MEGLPRPAIAVPSTERKSANVRPRRGRPRPTGPRSPNHCVGGEGGRDHFQTRSDGRRAEKDPGRRGAHDRGLLAPTTSGMGRWSVPSKLANVVGPAGPRTPRREDAMKTFVVAALMAAGIGDHGNDPRNGHSGWWRHRPSCERGLADHQSALRIIPT